VKTIAGTSAQSPFGTPNDPLIILDLANNHNGSVDHGLRIIDEVAEVTKKYRFRVAIKFQYRHLSTFIHPAFENRFDLKYIKRFQETLLSESEFNTLLARIRNHGLLAACTPFDEHSVSRVTAEGFDILKVASVSFTDWPLLEEVAKTNLPIVASTAGVEFEEIDRVASFLSNRSRVFALMHCVAVYPTPQTDLKLSRIAALRSRYENIPVGYSTHESPSDTVAVQLALALGARILERHIGIEAGKATLNEYSSSPETLSKWLRAIDEATERLGQDIVTKVSEVEVKTLHSLRRGVYMKRDVEAGNAITNDDVYFATPLQPGQVSANDWSKYAKFRTRGSAKKDSPLLNSVCTIDNHFDTVMGILRDTKELFTNAGVRLPSKSDLEISHHYGIEKFRQYGLLMVTVINREYCKKLLALLPGQTHPEQWHMKKEETFHCLHGEMTLVLDGESRIIRPGDVVTVAPGTRHAFSSTSGCVLEEISTTHAGADSYYTDPKITENRDRKTFVSFWS